MVLNTFRKELNKVHVPESNQTGFTLIELLTLLTVMTVLISLAIPSMQHLWTENRVDSTVNNLMSGLYYARSEAITRDENIVFCKSADQKTCGGQWGEGQIVLDHQGNVLRTFSQLPKTDAYQIININTMEELVRVNELFFTMNLF